MRFHVRVLPDEEPTGPWSRRELLSRAQRGNYCSQTVVRAEGEETWRPLEQIIPINHLPCSGPVGGATLAWLIHVVRRRYQSAYAIRRIIHALAFGYEVLGALIILTALCGVAVRTSLPADEYWMALVPFLALVVGMALIGAGLLTRAAAHALGALLDIAVQTRVSLEVVERDAPAPGPRVR